MKKYALISLGCPKNLVDSETFAYLADNANFEYTENVMEAEWIIVNTCGFINDAKEESVNTILDMAEMKHTGKCEKLIATGCLIKRYGDQIAENIPEIDNIIELKDFTSFAKLLGKQYFYGRKLLTPSHYAYLRISDGCNNNCTYCAIPKIRGKLLSRPMAEILEEARTLANQGVKEIIVNAQDTAQYGFDLSGEFLLPELLEKLEEIKGFKWIRLLYLHPAHLTTEIIDFVAGSNKILPYFEVPLQHISDNMLKKMNRHTNKENIINKLNEIKEKIPEAVVRTTFITGFPGETEKDFQEILDFIKEYKFGRLGVFTYSQEDGTPAFDFDNQVPEEIAINRKDQIMEIQQEISKNYLENYVGKIMNVIIDKESDEDGFMFEGRSFIDAPEIDGVVFIEKGKAKIGEIIKVKIIDSGEYDLFGEIV
jgi:ribosomal protein S12 methylthiotransferase